MAAGAGGGFNERLGVEYKGQGEVADDDDYDDVSSGLFLTLC